VKSLEEELKHQQIYSLRSSTTRKRRRNKNIIRHHKIT